MNKNLLYLALLLVSFYGYTQNDTIKKTPILFADISYGISRNFNDGIKLMIGTEITYQHKKNVFSLRYVENDEFKTIFILFPYVVNKSQEFAVLYGKRWIEDDFSYSISTGFSTTKYSEYEFDKVLSSENYLGVPLELNVKWFKSKKARFGLLYGMIPIGKSTAFGRSYGFKLIANFSKRTYVGIGLAYGLGVHKKYD